jgi:hypothetical protein
MNNTSIGARMTDRFFVREEDTENETYFRRKVRRNGEYL